LPASGKSTLAFALEERLVRAGRAAYVLDGDNIRHGLNANLRFSAEDRTENIRRIGEVARLFADAGMIVIAAFVSPYRADRERVRALHDAAGLPFIEVYLETPVEVCEGRDPKGMYAKARAGGIANFTGVNDPYEAPEKAEMALDSDKRNVEDCAEAASRMRGGDCPVSVMSRSKWKSADVRFKNALTIDGLICTCIRRRRTGCIRRRS
jgi:bifunctional enzyme CysN/CysC